jgi:hypothetical protein
MLRGARTARAFLPGCGVSTRGKATMWCPNHHKSSLAIQHGPQDGMGVAAGSGGARSGSAGLHLHRREQSDGAADQAAAATAAQQLDRRVDLSIALLNSLARRARLEPLAQALRAWRAVAADQQRLRCGVARLARRAGAGRARLALRTWHAWALGCRDARRHAAAASAEAAAAQGAAAATAAPAAAAALRDATVQAGSAEPQQHGPGLDSRAVRMQQPGPEARLAWAVAATLALRAALQLLPLLLQRARRFTFRCSTAGQQTAAAVAGMRQRAAEQHNQQQPVQEEAAAAAAEARCCSRCCLVAWRDAARGVRALRAAEGRAQRLADARARRAARACLQAWRLTAARRLRERERAAGGPALLEEVVRLLGPQEPRPDLAISERGAGPMPGSGWPWGLVQQAGHSRAAAPAGGAAQAGKAAAAGEAPRRPEPAVGWGDDAAPRSRHDQSRAPAGAAAAAAGSSTTWPVRHGRAQQPHLAASRGAVAAQVSPLRQRSAVAPTLPSHGSGTGARPPRQGPPGAGSPLLAAAFLRLLEQCVRLEGAVATLRWRAVPAGE